MYYKLIIAIALLVVQCFSYQRDLDCFVEKDTGIINKESRWGNWIFNSSYCKNIRKDYFDRKYLEEQEAKWRNIKILAEQYRQDSLAKEEAYNDSIKAYNDLHKDDYYWKYHHTTTTGGLKRKVYYIQEANEITVCYTISQNTSGYGDYADICNGDDIDIYYSGEKIANVRIYESYIRGTCLINGADINHISACIRAYKKRN